MTSVAGRLPKNFKIVCTCTLDDSLLQVSGPIETQDELDAIVEALNIMRDWLPAKAKTENEVVQLSAAPDAA